jgi:hypothetical protein
MAGIKKALLPCFLIVSLLICPLLLSAAGEGGIEEKQNSPEAMAIDFVFVRPLGAAATLAGSVLFLVSWPFSALGGNSDEAMDSLVLSPARFTFQRPLGEFD